MEIELSDWEQKAFYQTEKYWQSFETVNHLKYFIDIKNCYEK